MTMLNLLDSIPNVLLLGAGPSCCAPSTYHALACPTLSHMDPYFIKIMDEIKSYLQQLMNTKNDLTVPLSTSGSGGMEATFVNIVEKGDKILVLENGSFSERMIDVSGRLGAEVTALHYEWGTPIDVDEVAAQLKKEHYKAVAMVYAETSTGILNPMEEIGSLVKNTDTLLLVDAVPALGGIPIKVDEWGIDICYSGSQKCLSCPPGLSPITVSPKAIEVIKNRQTKVPNWYLDMNMIMGYWGGGQSRVYHHTAPINMIYGLYQALYNIFDEGVDQVFARHMAAHHRLIAGIEELGWELLVDDPRYRLPVVNAVKIPAGVDAAAFRSKLLNDYRIEVGGGYGSLDGKVIRIGLMGYNAQPYNVDRLLTAMKEIIAG